MATVKQLNERVTKYTADIAVEERTIQSLRKDGAYAYGYKNPRGRQIKKQIDQAQSRLATARRRLRAAQEALDEKGVTV